MLSFGDNINYLINSDVNVFYRQVIMFTFDEKNMYNGLERATDAVTFRHHEA